MFRGVAVAEIVPVWVVRGGDNNELAAQIPTKQAVAVGWTPSLDLSECASKDDIRTRMEKIEPGSATPNALGQTYRFAKEIAVGDYILTPEKVTKRIHIARSAGPYRFDPSVFGEQYPHIIPVEYLRSVERSVFPQTIRNTLGSVLTVFRADGTLLYLESSGASLPESPTQKESSIHVVEVETDRELLADELEGQAKGQILEALDEIEHYAFQVFVAGLLEAVGYKAKMGQAGADGGVDILVTPDVFGLATPRIKVQVKNQKTSAGHQDVGYLNGVVNAGEKGLFVCTGGFTKQAKNATFVKDGRIALVDGPDLLDLILEHYENMSERSKALLPLRRIYVPESPPST